MKTLQHHLCLFLLVIFIFFEVHESRITNGERSLNQIRLKRGYHHGSHGLHPSTYHGTHQSIGHSTHHPTHHPTHYPTHHPTYHPTHHPTHHATHHATHHSTQYSTHYPTHHPTLHPTHHPTHYPTHRATHHSTRHSTHHSTQYPTHHSTHYPTHHPTLHLTYHGINQSTHHPTYYPTHYLTHHPTHHGINHSTSPATHKLKPHQRLPVSPSHYNYTTRDTGSTALGIHLAYKFGQLSRPTYTHYSFDDGYHPRYDHYIVHHYYHNRETVPSTHVIRSKDITECVGDSVEVCPRNTIALCTSNGVLMCVVNARSTVPCKDKKIQGNCFKSTISCHNNVKDLGCKLYDTTTINIPCMFAAKVQGAFKYINNTITPLHKSTPFKLSKKFCVMVVAVPVENSPTVPEMIFDDVKQLAEAFVKKLLKF